MVRRSTLGLSFMLMSAYKYCECQRLRRLWHSQMFLVSQAMVTVNGGDPQTGALRDMEEDEIKQAQLPA